MDYTTLTVQDLRTEARKRNLASGMTIAGASKATLIQALTSGVWPAPAPASDPAAALTAALAALMPAPGLDEDRVRQLIREEVPAPRTLTVTLAGRDPVTLDRQHERFPLLLAAAGAGVHVLLVGPAGTGKTSAAAATAKALGIPFEAISVGPQTSKADLLGFVDAGGTFHDTSLVRAFRDGGLFLIDELDAGHPGVLTTLNAALAGDWLSTPAGMIPRHAGFRCVASANTWGTGASRDYVGRNPLDAATLDRFASVLWPIDEGLEAAMIGVPAPARDFDVLAGGVLDPAAWLARVRSVRAEVERQQVRAVISPRAAKAGVALFAAGWGRQWVEEAILWRGMAADARARVEGGAK